MYNLFKLNNGLRVVVEKIDYVNSVSVGLWVGNGSRNENKKNNGISHFIEHMLFKGTNSRTAKEIAESIEDVGGQINAFTSKESTCFYIKVLDSHLDLALDILTDMLFNSKFTEEDIEKEKGVVIEEINMTEDSPEDVLSDLHSYSIWGDDPISLPILGTEESVRSFTRKQIVEYIENQYVPENSVLSISGNFDSKGIEAMVGKLFDKWSGNKMKSEVISRPSILNNHIFKEKDIEQLHLSLGIPGVETGSDDLYAALILNNIFGGGASSILFQRVREEKGLCYSIFSYLSSFKNTGIISIYTGLNPKYAVEAIELIKEELDSFVKNGVTDEKLHKAKEQLKGSYILGLESTSSRMFSNGKSVLFLNRINSPSDVLEKINRVNSTKLKEIMELTFGKGIQNSAFVGENIDFEILKNSLEGDVIAFKNKKSKGI